MEHTEKSLIFIVHKKTWKILFQDRHSISKTWEEWWFFGWSLDEWENHREAAIRELKEELDYDITNEFDYLWKISFEYENKIHNRYMYIDFTEQEDFLDYEWDGAVYFTYDELLELNLWPSDITSRLGMFTEYMKNKKLIIKK
jgi:8-oxo-dGTP pyrophosphatase MutT (NUDIX family)